MSGGGRAEAPVDCLRLQGQGEDIGGALPGPPRRHAQSLRLASGGGARWHTVAQQWVLPSQLRNPRLGVLSFPTNPVAEACPQSRRHRGGREGGAQRPGGSAGRWRLRWFALAPLPPAVSAAPRRTRPPGHVRGPSEPWSLSLFTGKWNDKRSLLQGAWGANGFKRRSH